MTIGKKSLTFSKLTLDDLGLLQAWCDGQVRDPFEVVAEQIGRGRFTRAQEETLLGQAIKQASVPKPRIGSAHCNELIESFEGFSEVVRLSLRIVPESARDPKRIEDARDHARDVVRSMNAAHVERLIRYLALRAVTGDEGQDDPKASTSGDSTTPP